MKLQPQRTKIINVIIISALEFSSLPPYLPMQVIDKPGQTAETFLQHHFPDAEQFIFLPPTFSIVITALAQNEKKWLCLQQINFAAPRLMLQQRR
jgi:hypothetical protein